MGNKLAFVLAREAKDSKSKSDSEQVNASRLKIKPFKGFCSSPYLTALEKTSLPHAGSYF